MKFEDLFDATDYIESEYMENLKVLYERLIQFQTLYGKDLIITSGFRSRRKHAAIYAAENRKRILNGQPEVPIPLGSKHLIGKAADIYDPDPQKDLRIWMKLNPNCLEDCELWAEQFDANPRVHLQSASFGSYKVGSTRYFKP